MQPIVGTEIELDIMDISYEGKGIGKADGLAVFVDETIPGDKVRVKLTKVKKNYAEGIVVELLTPSADREDNFCEHASACGGCPLAGMSYESQLALKQNQVAERIKRLGGVQNPLIQPILGMDEPLGYRNKATLPVSTGGNRKIKGGIIQNLGEPAVGFYKVRSHEVVNCDNCQLQTAPSMAAAETLRQFMKEDNITAWDETWTQGLMRHLIVKTAFATKEVMVILVVNGKGIPGIEKLIHMLDDAIADTGFSLESLYMNINTEKTSAIYGKDTLLLAGRKAIRDRIGELDLDVSPLSFYQINPLMTVKLYDKVLEYAKLTGSENVLDLYCGVGAIGLYCAGNAGMVLGIESVRDAVLDANRNAVLNGIVNARFILGKAEEVLPKLLEEDPEYPLDEDNVNIARHADVVILDPPRAGCPQPLLEAVAQVSPDRIVYVSCDPATLARDIKALAGLGYKFVEATPVDMFPWTLHVETVVLMIRNEN
jgi:23S rRNA (uracil1939-C5)-methyltransferase